MYLFLHAEEEKETKDSIFSIYALPTPEYTQCLDQIPGFMYANQDLYHLVTPPDHLKY